MARWEEVGSLVSGSNITRRVVLSESDTLAKPFFLRAELDYLDGSAQTHPRSPRHLQFHDLPAAEFFWFPRHYS